jgi:hypothetical protein
LIGVGDADARDGVHAIHTADVDLCVRVCVSKRQVEKCKSTQDRHEGSYASADQLQGPMHAAYTRTGQEVHIHTHKHAHTDREHVAVKQHL